MEEHMNIEEEKIDDLKRILVDDWLDGLTNWDELRKFSLNYDKNWLETDVLNSVLCEEVFGKVITMVESGRFNWNYITASSTVLTRNVQRLLLKLIQLETKRVESIEKDAERHRVMCGLLEWTIGTFEFHKPDLISSTFEYLAKIFSQSNFGMDIIQKIINIIFYILAKENTAKHHARSVEEQLSTFVAIYFNSFGEPSQLYNIADERQGGHFVTWQRACWCMKQMKVVSSSPGGIPAVIYGHNQLSVSANRYARVRSTFAVKSGIYFYEATLLTGQQMRIGWKTREADVQCFGNDQHSVCLNLHEENVVISHKDCLFRVKNSAAIPRLKVGTVVGCLLNLSQREGFGPHPCAFFMNGTKLEIEGASSIHLSDEPYYAAIELYEGEACYLNFGQRPFRNKPEKVQFSHFHFESCFDVRRYQLVNTIEIRNYSTNNIHRTFSPQPVIDNEFELFYNSHSQIKCDQALGIIMKQIKNISKDCLFESIEHFAFLRIIQSLIEVIGHEEQIENQMDTAAHLIGRVCSENFDKVIQEHLYEFLHPYLGLKVVSQRDIRTHRIICIVLLNTVKYVENYKDCPWFSISVQHLDVFGYLLRMLTQQDEWIVLYALLCLLNMQITDEQRTTLRTNAQFQRHVRKSLDSPNLLHGQLYFCANLFSDSLLLHPSSRPINIQEQRASLDLVHRSQHMQLSPDLLTARSDWLWQSGRSKSATCGDIFYFEATLATSGPMRIGWATQQTPLHGGDERFAIGNDKYSIAFDGFNRRFWHDSRQYRIVQYRQETTVEDPCALTVHWLDIHNRFFTPSCCPNRWQAGDVVGCLMDATERQVNFYFSLNGQLQYFSSVDTLIYSSPHPYYAAVSLGQHQQCKLNFGATPYKYPPMRVKFDSFHTPQPERGTFAKTINNIATQNITSSVIAMDQSNINNGKSINLNSKVNSSIKPVLEMGTKADPELISRTYPKQAESSSRHSGMKTMDSLCCKMCDSPLIEPRLQLDCCDWCKICRDCAERIRRCSEEHNVGYSKRTGIE